MYDPPLSYDKLPEHLKNDPVHSWRAKTGIELIHEEPTLEELNRIWANWLQMSDDQKTISDKKSVELFGIDNKTHYEQLIKKYTVNEQILEQLINIIKEGNYDYPYTTQFVIQDHHASTHHFDLRIKRDNYLASWAIPKAKLPEDYNEKILAIQTNNHNLSWLTFEGTIPEGNYGAGTVKIYDSGDCLVHQWTNVITITFNGNKIKDTYSLIRTNNKKFIIVKKKLKYERVLDDGLGL